VKVGVIEFGLMEALGFEYLYVFHCFAVISNQRMFLSIERAM